MAPKKAPAKVKQIPAKEICWVHCTDNNDCEWLITSKPDRSLYYLYRQTADGYDLVAKNTTPVSFDEIVYPPEVPKNGKRTR